MTTTMTHAYRYATEEDYRRVVRAIREHQPTLSGRAFDMEVERLLAKLNKDK